MTTPADCTDISGTINFIKAIENIIRNDGGILRKPIIAIWNTQVFNQKDILDNYLIGAKHW